LLYALLVRLWYMPWMFRRRVKKDERVLTVSDEGIWTKIASMEQKYSWSQIAEFYSDDTAIVLIRKNGNFFSVPLRAFKDEKERSLFIAQCRNSLGLA